MMTKKEEIDISVHSSLSHEGHDARKLQSMTMTMSTVKSDKFFLGVYSVECTLQKNRILYPLS